MRLRTIALSSSRESAFAKVVVYTKEGCHLCERVIAQLEGMNTARDLEIFIQDITADPEVHERYSNIIPVVAIDGKVRLAGEALANATTLEGTLRRALSK